MRGSTDQRQSRHGAGRERRARADRGILGIALVVSVLLHIAVFFAFRFEIHVSPEQMARPIAPLMDVEIVPAMKVYDLVEVQGEAAPVAVQIERRTPERPTEAGPPPGVIESPVAGDDIAGAELDPTAVRDRLRYRMSRPEVWQPPSAERLAELTPQEIAEQRLAAQLAEFNDSVAAEAAARERATDWTVKDGDGGRWGVSPGKIHLGSITLPLPFALAAAPGRREEFAGRVRTWNEIQAQASRIDANDDFKDRVKAIEERRNRERASRQNVAADSTRATPPPKSGGGG